jgi:hypothetical protein
VPQQPSKRNVSTIGMTKNSPRICRGVAIPLSLGKTFFPFIDTVLVDLALSNAEQASCAPLAVDILPEAEELGCDISPP